MNKEIERIGVVLDRMTKANVYLFDEMKSLRTVCQSNDRRKGSKQDKN